MSDIETTQQDAPVPTPDHLALVALQPADLAATQAELTSWLDRKIAQLDAEADDLDENYQFALKSNWRISGFRAALNRVAQRQTYYRKIQAAIQAGYLIIPNFPITAIAVRVSRDTPRWKMSEWQSRALVDVTPELLPAGQGRYVDDKHVIEDVSYESREQNGTTNKVQKFRRDSFDEELDFPFLTVKPQVLGATQRAIALKIFDQIGIVQNTTTRRGDPIVIGQLLDPRGRGKACSFFIAWWLNTSDL